MHPVATLVWKLIFHNGVIIENTTLFTMNAWQTHIILLFAPILYKTIVPTIILTSVKHSGMKRSSFVCKCILLTFEKRSNTIIANIGNTVTNIDTTTNQCISSLPVSACLWMTKIAVTIGTINGLNSMDVPRAIRSRNTGNNFCFINCLLVFQGFWRMQLNLPRVCLGSPLCLFSRFFLLYQW